MLLFVSRVRFNSGDATALLECELLSLLFAVSSANIGRCKMKTHEKINVYGGKCGGRSPSSQPSPKGRRGKKVGEG
jgi:hypothetical protein